MMQAKVITDSVSPAGDRITTIEATFHRMILAEFNTHRSHSRNSASSRAIPFRKQVERVMLSPAVPVSFPAEQRGMQGGDELDATTRHDAEIGWLHARNSAVQHAQHLANLGVHKSVVNRLLEPFMYHTVIATADAQGWDNLFHQRCHPHAQPEFRVAAELMQSAYDASTPAEVQLGEWHLPYIDGEDWDAAIDRYDTNDAVVLAICRVSAARCARVSYLTHDGRRDIDADTGLYDKLVHRGPGDDTPLHYSPLEHVATPATDYQRNHQLGNLRGWRQLRHRVGGDYA